MSNSTKLQQRHEICFQNNIFSIYLDLNESTVIQCDQKAPEFLTWSLEVAVAAHLEEQLERLQLSSFERIVFAYYQRDKYIILCSVHIVGDFEKGFGQVMFSTSFA